MKLREVTKILHFMIQNLFETKTILQQLNSLQKEETLCLGGWVWRDWCKSFFFLVEKFQKTVNVRFSKHCWRPVTFVLKHLSWIHLYKGYKRARSMLYDLKHAWLLLVHKLENRVLKLMPQLAWSLSTTTTSELLKPKLFLKVHSFSPFS
jgi:hypothetical protein